MHPEHRILRWLEADPRHGRGVLELLLNLLDQYRIPATWATVGHLFLKPGESQHYVFREMPQFKGGLIDWDFYSRVRDSPLYCAPDVIERIVDSPTHHEIGLHSFSHIPFSVCDEPVAELEVKLGADMARKWGVIPRSFVFPGNRIGHVSVLSNHGIDIYRGKDAGRYREGSGLLMRYITGAIDKVIAPPVVPGRRTSIWEIPGSMYFYDSQMPFTLLPRARLGLSRAIHANKVFHIWLHPWSLVQQESLYKALGDFLALVVQKRDSGDLQVMTMGELASYLNQGKEGGNAGSR